MKIGKSTQMNTEFFSALRILCVLCALCGEKFFEGE
jgi:hypothetical protein